MRPLVLTNGLALLAAAVLVIWLLSIELGTSRRSGTGAAGRDQEPVVESETATGRFFDVAAGTAIVVAIVAVFALDDLTIQPRVVSLLGGLVLMAVAIGLSHVARRHLGRFHRHELSGHQDHELVASGPYRFVRHPIYTATVTAFTGIGLALGNWVALAILIVLPTAALVRRIVVEEQILRRRLGPAYERYCAGRARLVPGLW